MGGKLGFYIVLKENRLTVSENTVLRRKLEKIAH
jgi:hypothetical protein